MLPKNKEVIPLYFFVLIHYYLEDNKVFTRVKDMEMVKNLFVYLSHVTMSEEIIKFVRHVNNKSKNPLRSLNRLIEYALAALIKHYEKDTRLLKTLKLKLMYKFIHTDAKLSHDYIADIIEIYHVSILTTLQEVEKNFINFHRSRYYERHSMSEIFKYNLNEMKKELEIVIQYSSGICLNFGRFSTLSIRRNNNHSGYSVTGTTNDKFIFLQRFSAEERKEAIEVFLKELEFALFYVYEYSNSSIYYQDRMAKIKSHNDIYQQLNMNIIPQQVLYEVNPSYRKTRYY